MKDYQAVLFDFDGVLVDSEPVHFACWQEILAPYRITLDWDYYEQNCIGVSDRAMIATLVPLANPSVEFDEIYAQYPRKKALFRDRMLAQPAIYEPTMELVRSLDGYKRAVVTSSGRTEVEPILDKLGLLPHLDATVFGGDVERLKPAPDPYLRAASLLGITRALVVEDSEAGIASGQAAGFDVVRITHARDVAQLVRDALRKT
ncbi:MAG: HAD family phosphatase [Acidobacteria bacterium]|nr:HAD family phosphatase [Acidobacteriota bacterium]